MHELPPLWHPIHGVTVDVHHNISPRTSRLQIDAGLLLADAIPTEIDSRFLRFSDVDLILHLCVHLFHDDEMDNSLRELNDLAMLLRRFAETPGFWERLLERARRLGVMRLLYYGLEFSTRWLDVDAPRQVVDRVASAAPPRPIRPVLLLGHGPGPAAGAGRPAVPSSRPGGVRAVSALALAAHAPAAVAQAPAHPGLAARRVEDRRAGDPWGVSGCRPRPGLLTIDLDDTLWPCLPTIKQAERELYDWLSGQVPELTEAYAPEDLRAHRRQLAIDRPRLAHDVTALRLESLRLLMAAFDRPPELAQRASAVFRRARNRVEPFFEVAEVLGRLKSRYVLVSVTNGNAQVEHTPLCGCFHLSLSAADVGAAKPDPALFEAARAYAGVAAPETLHLGDDPRLDVEAARRHGQRAVWMNRERKAWPEELEPPELEVQDLRQLEAFLSD